VSGKRDLVWDETAKLGMLRAVIDPADETGVKNDIIDRLHWRVLKPWLRDRTNVLDFGCGTGRFARRVLDLGMSYSGVDGSAAMVQAAGKYSGAPDRFVQCESVPLPFQDTTFDACISCLTYQYIIHTPAELPVVEDIARLLKPSGRLLLLEQVSLSGRSSSSVSTTSTIDDYVHALERHFSVQSVQVIRSSKLSPATRRLLRRGRPIPLVGPAVGGWLAAHELRYARGLTPGDLAGLDYYDVLIVATKAPLGTR
jgi:SAM-dependent methyltransferase